MSEVIIKDYEFISSHINVKYYHWDNDVPDKYEITNRLDEFLGIVQYWSPKKEFIFKAEDSKIYPAKSLSEILRLVDELNKTLAPEP